MYDSPKNVSEVKLLSLQKYIAVLIFTIYRRIKRWVKNGFKIYWEIVADDGETWLEEIRTVLREGHGMIESWSQNMIKKGTGLSEWKQLTILENAW